MHAPVINRVFVRRYSPHNTLGQSVYCYLPEAMTLDPCEITSEVVSGWLVTCEIPVSGAREVIFFHQNGTGYIALDREVFSIDAGSPKIVHEKGLLLSSLCVTDVSGRQQSITYLTPWWRLIFDDGSHPDLQFPLEYFSNKYASLKFSPPVPAEQPEKWW